ncbi:transglutaminase family protein [Demequina mangrovi]|uniref:Transglutaminase-like enzyme, putative cysteine protease n=1 Tax=Demequina mangrovi TaxID=1043493 RepID=A0A1H6UVV8_9MICO|nr:transglutaminase family protein [Demequina mangrovi]SEI96499.1 Transglutaminase-like enzyme, putative cysteine protease [Demequina mangrovi]
MSTLRIEHRTAFTYSGPIVSSYNEARLTPAWLPRQRVLESKVEVSPVTWRSTYRDYWEAEVHVFEVLQQHEELTVVGSSLVEVSSVAAREERASWDTLKGPRFQDLLSEYLGLSDVTEPTEELAEVAREAAGRLDPDGTARAICDHLYDQVKYVPGATTVHTPARDAWDARSGVCQDFAHLAIGALRTVGIPARYVSGYLHPKRDAEIGETVSGESHAWVEWWTGDWFGFDPTNDREVGDHHVIVARAREYTDVPPLTGVVAGSTTDLDVSVRVTQVE